MAEGDAAVLGLSQGGTTVEYWIRCLPADFPTITASPYPDAGAAQAGYYLFGNVSFGTGESPYAIVVDANGTPVWYRRSPSSAGVLNVESLSPGTISFAALMPFTLGAGPVGQYEIVGLQPWQVAYTAPAGIPLDEHELRVLANGDSLMLSDVIRAGFDLTGLQSFGPGSSIIDCTIQEVDPSGNSVWQWNATDHFDIVQDSTWPLTWMVDGENVVDPFHCNSIDVASNGDLLVSARHMDSIFYIDKVTGRVVWKMGGSQFTKDGASYVTVTGDPETTFYRQHDARFQAGGAISLFDDHTEEPGPARGVVYTVDADADTATMAWQYPGAGSSAAMGSFRPTAGGGAIIGWGQPAAGNIVFSEVDRDGNDLLDMQFAAPDVSYRAIKVALGDLDIDVLRKTAGLP